MSRKCPVCEGTGLKYMHGDFHKSGGIVPCNYHTDTEYCDRGTLRQDDSVRVKSYKPTPPNIVKYDRSAVLLKKIIKMSKKGRK